MKNALMLFCSILAVLFNYASFAQTPTLPPGFGPHQWTANVKVIDEEGNPVTGAEVAIQYTVPTPPDSGQQSFGEVKGTTDTNGIFSASHTDSSHGLGVFIEKIGYYPTHWGQQFYFDDKNRHPSFTLLLKRIGKPIGMFSKRVNLGMPVFDKPVGYDLMVADWVAPYGKGTSSNIIFTAHTDKRSEFDWDSKLVVSFPNPGDGIQEFTVPEAEKGGVLRSSHEAPIAGYQPQWVQSMSCRPHVGGYSGNRNANRNYLFRVDTVLDENGNVKSALYGKIYGDFMQFTYYLNPKSNDRNIEFDPNQNLLGGLQPAEQVTVP